MTGKVSILFLISDCIWFLKFLLWILSIYDLYGLIFQLSELQIFLARLEDLIDIVSLGDTVIPSYLT